LAALEEGKTEGSCLWFTAKQQYQSWRDVNPGSVPNYWLTGQPGAGKSIMAAHVIRNLDSMNANCSFYFFKHNDTARSSSSLSLRSIAYQMALLDFRVWQRLLDMKHNDIRFDRENELVVWRKVFLNGILDLSLEKPHFWVIDALDECSSSNSIAAMLAKVPANLPLRVFMTSRRTIETADWFSQLNDLTYADQMIADDTRNDIELCLNAKIKSLPLQTDDSRQYVAEVILEKSNGSFLWVILVLKEMRLIVSEADIQRILDEVPPRLDALYERTLKKMSQMTRGKVLIKSILQWAVCAIRPLSIKEMEHALKLDTGERVLDLERFLGLSCEQLIHVDKSGKVSLVHETVRSFLLQEDLDSEFAIERSVTHGRITDICLQYLNSDEMKPPKSQKLMQMYRTRIAKRSAFADYACPYFSEHLRRSSSKNTERFIKLCNFLEGNVCSWIEHMARNSHLHYMTRTAKDMRGFLQARAKHYSPISKGVQCVGNWESDMLRLVTQFGKHLSEYPSAIFWLIPPFCPPLTQIASQFGENPTGIIVRGLPSSTWSDRISSIHYRREVRTRAVCCAAASFAVGLSDSGIKIYSHATCQETQQLTSPQPVKCMIFSTSGKLLAVSTIHFVMMFSLETGSQIWQVRLPQESLTMAFADQDSILWLVTKGGVIMSLSVADGSKRLQSVLEHPPDTDDSGFRRVLTYAGICLELGMVASVQRGRPISLHDLNTGSLFDVCERDCDVGMEGTDHASIWIRDLIFATNPVTSYIAALYHDGDLVLFDPCELSMKAHVLAEAQVLAASPDGYALVAGNDTGTIQIFDLETLTLMHKIISSDHSIRSLAFSVDGIRFIDIRGSQCNIWGPPILVHADHGETRRISDTILEDPSVVGVNIGAVPEITALVCHSNGDYIFCGRDDGAIALFSSSDGKEAQILYNHAQGVAIKLLIWGSKSNTLVSADAASRFMIWRIMESKSIVTVKGPLLDDRIHDQSIRQLLLDTEEERLLVSTAVSDTVYDIASGANTTISFSERPSWKWVNHPRDSNKLIHVTAQKAYIYSWDGLSDSQSSLDMHIASDVGAADMSVKAAASCSDGCKLSIEFSTPSAPQSTSHVLILAASSFDEPSVSPIASIPAFSKLAPNIEHLTGSVGRRLIFLNRRMWICSLDLESFSGEYYQHCFIPDDWLNANWNFILKVTNKGDLVFVKKSEIVVIKCILNSKEILTKV
jgi:WD40 repeat protein